MASGSTTRNEISALYSSNFIVFQIHFLRKPGLSSKNNLKYSPNNFAFGASRVPATNYMQPKTNNTQLKIARFFQKQNVQSKFRGRNWDRFKEGFGKQITFINQSNYSATNFDAEWRQILSAFLLFFTLPVIESQYVPRSVMSSSRSENEQTSPPQQFTGQDRFSLSSKIKIIPEGGWGWMICGAAFVAQLIVMGIHNSFGILYTKLLQEYKKSKAQTGMLIFCWRLYFLSKKKDIHVEIL